MHKLDEGYKPKFNKKQMDIMFKTYTNNSYKCRCGHTVAIAKNCEKLFVVIVEDMFLEKKKDEFMYRLKEVM